MAYTVDFGINPATFNSGIAAMEAGVESLSQEVASTTTEMQKGFDEAARGSTQLKNSILGNVQAAKELKAEVAGGTVPGFERFQAVIGSLQSNLETLRLKLGQATDPKQIQALTQQIGLLDTQVKSLNTTFAAVKGPNFGQSIGVIQGLENQLVSLRQKLVAATDPTQIANYNKTIAALTDQVGKYRSLGLEPAIRGNNQFASSLGNISPVAGRANQSLNDVGRIVQDLPFGFVAISNNISPLVESFGRLRAETGSTGGAIKGLLGGLAGAGGLGFAFSAITSILTFASIGMQAWGGRTKDAADNVKTAKEENDKFIESLNGVSKALLKGEQDAQKEIIALDSLYRATQNTNLSQSERLAAVDELQKKYPDYFAKLSDEAILAGNAATAYDQLKEAIIAGAKARAAAAIIEEDQKTVLTNERRIADLQREQIKNLADYQKLQATGQISTGGGSTGGAGNLGNVSNAAQINAAQNKINDNVKKEAELRTDILKLKSQDLDLTEEINKQQEKGGVAAITGNYGDPNADKKAEAAADKAQKEREKALKLAADQEKAFTDLFIKIVQERETYQAKAIQDNQEAEIAASDARFKQLVEDRAREIETANVSDGQRKKLQLAFLNDILTIQEAAEASRTDIIAKYAEKERKLREAAQKAISTLSDNTLQLQIDKINLEYEEKAKAIERGGLLTAEVSKQVEGARQAAVNEAQIKYYNERIKKNEQLEIAGIKVAEKYQGKSVAIEKAKQLAILEAQLDGAESRLANLFLYGKTTEDLEVKQAQEAINNLKQAIKNQQGNNGEGQSLFEFLGISAEAGKDISRYSDAAKTAGKVVSDFLGILISGYDQQLKAKQEIIDQDDRELDNLQDRLDQEKDLKDQGFANDYDRLQAELEAKKAQREEDVKSAEEIQKKKQAAQKAQLIADTITQASSLITASAEIFAAFAPIPFVGVPLAIAAIGLMLGSFVSAKVQAFKSIGQAQQFGEGGWVDGQPHSKGGKKYRAIDGSGDVVELEGGEHVTRKDNAKKAAPVLDAINDGSLWDMNELDFRNTMHKMGIHFDDEHQARAANIIHQKNYYEHKVLLQPVGESKALTRIDQNVAEMNTRQRNKTEHWTEHDKDGTWDCFKKGNSTKRVKVKTT